MREWVWGELAGWGALVICASEWSAGGRVKAVSKTNVPPSFQSFLYPLALLLPVASLHQRDGWVANGAAQWWSVFFIVMGWILATAVVLSLTGLLKRDS